MNKKNYILVCLVLFPLIWCQTNNSLEPHWRTEEQQCSVEGKQSQVEGAADKNLLRYESPVDGPLVQKHAAEIESP